MGYPYLKDLVIYVIPGLLLNIIILAILFDKDAIKVITYIELIKSNAFIFSFLIFSVLSGFIQSQFQINLINRVIYRHKDMRQILNQDFPLSIRGKLIDRIRKDFGLAGVTDQEILTDKEYFYQCLTVIHLGEYKRVDQIMERAVAMSQFASAIILPTILCVYYIFTKINVPSFVKWPLFSVVAVLTAFVCYQTVKRFRMVWIENVYKGFLYRNTAVKSAKADPDAE